MVKPTIGIIGAGYVGLVVASSYASKGYRVLLFEKDVEKKRLLQQGVVPFFEPELPQLFASVLDCNLLICEELKDFFTQNLPVDIIFSCVATPVLPDGELDTSAINSVLADLVKFASKDILLINKSTITPGLSAVMEASLQPAKVKITMVYNPEFLRQGQAVIDFMHPDRIVFGLPAAASDHLKAQLLVLATNFADEAKIIFTDLVTAEFIKHAANAMLACRVTFMNQIFRLAKKLGADMQTISQGVGMDHRIGSHYLTSGPGFGGSCLPKDLKALIGMGKKLAVDVSLLQAIASFNESQVDWFYQQWQKEVGGIKDRTVAVQGVSFKADTSDLRNSVQLALVRRIAADKPKSLLLLDPTLGKEELARLGDELGVAVLACDDEQMVKEVLADEKTVILARS